MTPKEPKPGRVPPDAGPGYSLWRRENKAPQLRLEFWSTAAERVLELGDVTDLWIDKAWKPKDDIGFLAQYASQLRNLTIAAPRAKGMSVVGRLSRLSELTLRCAPDEIDFQGLDRLRTCYLSGLGGLSNLSTLHELETLGLFDRIRLPNLEDLSPLAGLKLLRVYGVGALKSLYGIEALSIETLDLADLRNLESFEALGHLRSLSLLSVNTCRSANGLTPAVSEMRSLQHLMLESTSALPGLSFLTRLSRLSSVTITDARIEGPRCSLKPVSQLAALTLFAFHGHRTDGARRLVDLDALGQCRLLEELRIVGGPPILSLDFLRGLTRLRKLDLSRTPIKDPDLSVFLELPRLEEVSIETDPKRHAYTEDQIRKLLKGGKAREKK